MNQGYYKSSQYKPSADIADVAGIANKKAKDMASSNIMIYHLPEPSCPEEDMKKQDSASLSDWLADHGLDREKIGIVNNFRKGPEDPEKRKNPREPRPALFRFANPKIRDQVFETLSKNPPGTPDNTSVRIGPDLPKADRDRWSEMKKLRDTRNGANPNEFWVWDIMGGRDSPYLKFRRISERGKRNKTPSDQSEGGAETAGEKDPKETITPPEEHPPKLGRNNRAGPSKSTQ